MVVIVFASRVLLYEHYRLVMLSYYEMILIKVVSCL